MPGPNGPAANRGALHTMNDETLPPRFLELAPDQLTPEQQSGLDALMAGRGRIPTPYKVWLHSPGLLRAIEQLGTFLNTQSTLTPRQIELGICLIARHWRTDYLFRTHGARAIKSGIPPAVIEAIRDDKTPELPDPRERAVYELATLVQQPGSGPDEAFDSAVAALGRDGLAEVICLLGYYSAVAIAMKLHRVPIPPAP
jgi:4-carboxymuconolactone decarboxylase